MFRFITLAAMAIFSMAAGPYPVELTIEVGSVSGVARKTPIKIAQISKISKDAIVHRTVLTSTEDFHVIRIPGDNLNAVEKAVADCLANPAKEQKFKAGIVTIECKGKKGIEVNQAGMNDSMLFDANNARSLLAMLKKAEEARDWMAEKAPSLQK